jgi:hypothetical protein
MKSLESSRVRVGGGDHEDEDEDEDTGMIMRTTMNEWLPQCESLTVCCFCCLYGYLLQPNNCYEQREEESSQNITRMMKTTLLRCVLPAAMLQKAQCNAFLADLAFSRNANVQV